MARAAPLTSSHAWLCRKSGWDIDCVVPVPDGSRPAAIQMSAELGLPYREGLVKNRYVNALFHIILIGQHSPNWTFLCGTSPDDCQKQKKCYTLRPAIKSDWMCQGTTPDKSSKEGRCASAAWSDHEYFSSANTRMSLMHRFGCQSESQVAQVCGAHFHHARPAHQGAVCPEEAECHACRLLRQERLACGR